MKEKRRKKSFLLRKIYANGIMEKMTEKWVGIGK